MRTTLLVLLLLASAASASDSVWKWVDGDGVTHYSDRPVPGATKVELRSINQANSAGSSPATSNSSTTPPPAVPSDEKYRVFEISAPAPEQAFINTGGQISIALRLDPALRPGDTLSVLLDGQSVPGSPGSALQYTVKDVPRGEHTVSATISNPSNQPVASAAAVRFYVRQPMVKNPATGAKSSPARTSTMNPNANPGSNMPQRSGR